MIFNKDYIKWFNNHYTTEYSVGDKIIFNKNYRKKYNYYKIEDSKGWVEPWLVGQVATITKKEKAQNLNLNRNFYWYYIDIPDTHGYDEALFNKFDEELFYGIFNR